MHQIIFFMLEEITVIPVDIQCFSAREHNAFYFGGM